MQECPDVVVVGAGAAGISATHTLLSLGLSVTTVEAAARIGGRCWTDSAAFGVPYDVGAHWLHYGDQNFYLSYGRDNGFQVYRDTQKYELYEKNLRRPNGSQLIHMADDRFWTAIQKAIDNNLDISVAEATGRLSDRDLADFIYGPWIMGKETEEFSVFEYSSGVDGADWFCRQGFGAIVARYGQGLPISLQTEVTAIDWSGKCVNVQTKQGKIPARAVILTVSTGVLANDSIGFKPSLPIEKRESFAAVSMGCYEHIVLQLSDGVPYFEPDSYIIRAPDGNRAGFGALTNISGSGLIFCDVGGNVARELMRLGESACIDYALQELSQLFGTAIKKHTIRSASSAWLTHPYTMGSYASAKPGAFHMRKILREPIGDRIFFAGEACHPSMWATVAGAHASGYEAAVKVGELLS